MIHFCHRCDSGAKGVVCSGDVPCRADPQRRDIRVMVRVGCPKGYFDASITPDPTSCAHRGDQIGEEQCETCAGRVMAKVVACSIHGRATRFDKPIPGVKACGMCADRKPVTTKG